jgi:putative spermidine/putrescine transport system permease protein
VVLFCQPRAADAARCSAAREISPPTAATVLIVMSIMLLTTVELLRRRSERLRGIRT